MSLRKKHFVKVAEILNHQLGYYAISIDNHTKKELEANRFSVERIADNLSDYFATENAQFDRQRFKQSVLKGVIE